ncbi:HNH endonuclease [Occallatibacter savannae]|uniref:HNH endonuclease n=1 Tax=Occallatibacter savannae TaxID=1002691 RepID=UPI000D68A2B9|nr:HNH endonuclease domain-containing protein [Occallatibacter savannae]
MPPSPEEQVQFLLKVQRLLGEGLFSATYKYALLMALADLSVEIGDDSGSSLDIDAERIAEKFIEYYWRQTLPFLGSVVLRQNAGKAPVVVRLLLQIRNKYGDSLASAQRDSIAWRALARQIAANIRAMPLRYLQNVGRERIPFLYDPPQGIAPKTIRLYPGVAFCLRRFHGLIAELVQAGWTKWVRQQNLSFIGESADLHEFLFGATRATLLPLQVPLRELQRNLCFYCQKPLRQADVDHFVPWALYPLDLGHNFVLAHKECNSAKRDLLASEEHLSTWVERNRSHGEELGNEFDRLGVIHNLGSTTRIAHWAYSSASVASGLTWQARETLVPLRGEWLMLLH